MEERAAASKRELEELASLVVLLAQRVDRLFQLNAAQHQRLDEHEALLRQGRTDLHKLEGIVWESAWGKPPKGKRP